MYEVFAFVDEQFKTPLENFISTGTSNISEWVSGPLTAAVTLYIVLYGYLVLRGSVRNRSSTSHSARSSLPSSSCW